MNEHIIHSDDYSDTAHSERCRKDLASNLNGTACSVQNRGSALIFRKDYAADWHEKRVGRSAHFNAVRGLKKAHRKSKSPLSFRNWMRAIAETDGEFAAAASAWLANKGIC